MNFLKKLAVPLCLLAVCFGAGCKKTEEYKIFTNIPSGQYEVKNKNFNVQFIEGLNLQEEKHETEDVSGYTSMNWLRYMGVAEAELNVSDDFTKDGAKTKFDSLIVDINLLHGNIDRAVSTAVANSDINAFNAAEPGETVEIGPVAYEIMSTAMDIYTFTEGYYNPALYYNVLAYGFGSAQDYPHKVSELPKDDLISKYTDLASHFGEIVLSENEGKYFVTKPDCSVEVDGEAIAMKLDLNGISKGYMVDRIEKLFDKYGYNYGMFNYGFSSVLVRRHFRAGNYTLQLKDPRSHKIDSYIHIPASNKKLSTSGDYVQYYTIDGVRYCHIIDPTTGKPVRKGIMTATVIGGSAAEDDALTTAIMCMGKDKAIEFIKEKLTDRMVVFTYGA